MSRKEATYGTGKKSISKDTERLEKQKAELQKELAALQAKKDQEAARKYSY